MALGYGIRRGYRAIRAIEKILEGVEANTEHVRVALAQLEEIRKEVKPNGGSSLKDVVNRVDRRVAVLEALWPASERIYIEEASHHSGHASPAGSGDEPHPSSGEGYPRIQAY